MWTPWRKKKSKSSVEADQAVQRSTEQREVVRKQREAVNRVVGEHRNVLAVNHIAEAMRKAMGEPR